MEKRQSSWLHWSASIGSHFRFRFFFSPIFFYLFIYEEESSIVPFGGWMFPAHSNNHPLLHPFHRTYVDGIKCDEGKQTATMTTTIENKFNELELHGECPGLVW